MLSYFILNFFSEIVSQSEGCLMIKKQNAVMLLQSIISFALCNAINPVTESEFITMNKNTYQTTDKNDNPIVIEWQKTTFFSQEFAEAMKIIWPVAKTAYLPVEMDFLKAFPEVVGTEDYFKSFEPLFKNGMEHVDWHKAEEIMEALLKSHFIFDTSSFGPEIFAQFEKDICYIVTVKDQKSNALLGFITFMIRATYKPGDVKVMSLAVDPNYQNHGLGKILMSSIFKIDPTIKRIFLCTRVTNKTALNAYRAWGFTPDKHPTLDHAFNLNHWMFLEYKADEQQLLQNKAKEMKE